MQASLAVIRGKDQLLNIRAGHRSRHRARIRLCDIVSVVTIGRVNSCHFFILVCDNVEQVLRLFKQLFVQLRQFMFGIQASNQATDGCVVKPLPDLLQDLPNHRVKAPPREPDLLTSPGVTRGCLVSARRGQPFGHSISLRHHQGSSCTRSYHCPGLPHTPGSLHSPGSRHSSLHWCQFSQHFLKNFVCWRRIMCGQLDPRLDPLLTSAGGGPSLSPVVEEDADHLEDEMGYLALRCDAVREIPVGVNAGSEEPRTAVVDSAAVTSIVQELRKIGDSLDSRMSSEKEPQAQMALWNFKRQFGYDLAMTLTFQHVVQLVGTAVELCYLLSRL